MEALRLTAALGSLGPAAAYTTRLAQAAGLGELDSYRLRLAVDELVTNITTYGYGEDPAGVIELAGSVETGTVVLHITDWSPPFDPVNAPSPDFDPTTPPERRPPGGYGLVLVRQVSDVLSYRRVGDENQTTIVIRRGTGRSGHGVDGADRHRLRTG